MNDATSCDEWKVMIMMKMMMNSLFLEESESGSRKIENHCGGQSRHDWPIA